MLPTSANPARLPPTPPLSDVSPLAKSSSDDLSARMARIRERPSYEGIPSDRMECLGSKLESYGLDATLELLQAEKENDTAVPRLVASEKVSNYQSDRNASSHLPSGFPETSLSLCESCQDIRSNHNQSVPTAVPEAETATTLSSLTVVSGSQSAVGPQRAKTLSDARPASSRAVLVASPIRQSMDKIEVGNLLGGHSVFEAEAVRSQEAGRREQTSYGIKLPAKSACVPRRFQE